MLFPVRKPARIWHRVVELYQVCEDEKFPRKKSTGACRSWLATTNTMRRFFQIPVTVLVMWERRKRFVSGLRKFHIHSMENSINDV